MVSRTRLAGTLVPCRAPGRAPDRPSTSVERLAVVVERDHSGNLLAQRLHLGVIQWIAGGDHPHVETITDLRGLNTDLAFVVTVQAKCHPHHAVKAALVAMPEPHHRDLPQIERPGDVQLGRGGRRGGHRSQSVTAH